MIKSVLFDIDGALLDSFEANLKFFQDLMTQTGYRPPTREEYKTLFHVSMMDLIRVLTRSNSEKEILRVWEIGRSREVPYEPELSKTPDHAEKVIKELSKDYLLGIVTSRIKESVYESPDLAKLSEYFKIVVSYQDTINHKPHPEPLLLAAQKLGVKPKECVYIGDVENDVKAAHAAGMTAIVYSKDKILGADANTSLFIELPSIIQKLS